MSRVGWAVLVLALAMSAVGCTKKAPAEDDTPPQLEMAWFAEGDDGGQGVQRNVTMPYAQVHVPYDFLGESKANIRAIARDTEGVGLLDIKASGKGRCVTRGPGKVHTTPDDKTAGFSVSTKTDDGTVKETLSLPLDRHLLHASCGQWQLAGMDGPEEFFLEQGQWSVTVTASNCCDVKRSAPFKLTLT